MSIHQLFSDKSELYEIARPLYPKELYEYLVSIVPSTQQVWDCACGNGQAAISLVQYFDHVKATDVSQEQIANAKQHPKIEYAVSESEDTNFADNSFDLVCVAQALHWFQHDQFWNEVKRVLKPNGIFAAWGYTWPRVNTEVDQIVKEKILNSIAPYWAPQNKLLWNHYADIDIPFKNVSTPAMKMQVVWDLDEFIGFIRSYSATRRCIEKEGDQF